MEHFVTELAESLSQNLWWGPLIAFVIGIAASFTPCCLANVPVIVGYVGGYSGEDRRRPVVYSLVYALGSIITIVALGLAVSTIGEFVEAFSRWWYLLLAAIMVLMALQIWGVVAILPHRHHHVHHSTRKGVLGAFGLGLIGGAFASPCSTPVLIAILAVVSTGGLGIVSGTLMLLAYAVGHSILVVAAGIWAGRVVEIVQSKAAEKAGRVFSLASGALMIAFAGFLVWLALFGVHTH